MDLSQDRLRDDGGGGGGGGGSDYDDGICWAYFPFWPQ
jgi:hypothetical protein